MSNYKIVSSKELEYPIDHQLILHMRQEMTAEERSKLIESILGNFNRDGSERRIADP